MLTRPPARPSILAIDDNPANLKLLAELLSDVGFDVRVVLDGETGLRTALRLPPDLILLDVKMPGMDGFEVCQMFKARRELAEIPVVFVSAAEETMDKVKAFKVGGVDYIVRPFQREEVLARVTTQIKLYHAYRQAQELAAMHERERLARELHDVVNQTLFSINLTAETAVRQHEHHPEKTLDTLQNIRHLAQSAMVEMRVLMYELRPDSLHSARLDALLTEIIQSLTANTSLVVTTRIATPVQPPFEVQIAFYRIAQEALTNIIRHAQATHVEISLDYTDDGLRLSIRDDGKGFDLAHPRTGHYGLPNIRARAAAIHAICTLHSQPGSGTQITLDWEGE